MAEYDKPWLSAEQQMLRLRENGLDLGEETHADHVLTAIGYYRLTGYLHPFRESELILNDEGQQQVRVLSSFRPGTTLRDAEELIDFDRRLRLLVLEAMERIEIAVRMRSGYVLGRRSAFAHEEPQHFTDSFTADDTDIRHPSASKHVQWLARVSSRQSSSDEQFVEHFRTVYDGRMPIWALTEILELGHLSVLYRGINQTDAEEIAHAFGAPTKKLMTSWLGSLNYVRNVSAHHARLFNRKLQNAPGRPKTGAVPLLDHLRDSEDPKRVFGLYNALAVMAYLLRSVDSGGDWTRRSADLLRDFPGSAALTASSMGVPPRWDQLELWLS